MRRSPILLTALACLLPACAIAQTQSQTVPTTAAPAQTTQAAPATTTTSRPPQHKKPQTWTPGTADTPPADTSSKTAPDSAAPEFDHVSIEVTDLAKSADFYQRVLGLVQIADPFNDSRHLFLRLAAHSQLHLVKKAAAAPGAAATHAPAQISSKARGDEHFAIRVGNVADFAARLDRMKIAYSDSNDQPHKMTKRPDGVTQIYFQDPDGYWIEVNDAKY